MSYEFDGNYQEPYLMIFHRLTRSKKYLKWIGTLEFKVWMYLQTYIIRSPEVKTGRLNLYSNYYMNRKLVARWSQENIAKQLDTTKSSICRALRSLQRKGFIKVHKERIGSIIINIYEFGTHDFEGHETLYAHSYFSKQAAAEKLNDFRLAKCELAS